MAPVRPAVFDVDIRSGAADVAHIAGAFVLVVAGIAMAEVVRAVRLLGVPAGLAVAVVVLLVGAEAAYVVTLVVTGLLVAALSLPGRPAQERYGGWCRLTR